MAPDIKKPFSSSSMNKLDRLSRANNTSRLIFESKAGAYPSGAGNLFYLPDGWVASDAYVCGRGEGSLKKADNIASLEGLRL